MFLSLLIFVIGFVIVIGICSISTEGESNTFKGFVFVVIVITLIAWGFHTELNYRDAYKQGQIDALNGEYKYEMKVKQDTSYVKTDNS